MRLERQHVKVENLYAGDKTVSKDGNLHVDIEELKALLAQDETINSVELEVFHKDDDSTRFLNCVDVVQPMCKLEGGTDFPGQVGELCVAGQGITRVVDDVIVVMTLPMSGLTKYLTFLDTGGSAAKLSRHSGKHILWVTGMPAEGADLAGFSVAFRKVALKAAVYLAQHADNLEVEDTEVFELDYHDNMQNPDNLPRVACYYQLHSPHYDNEGTPPQLYYGISTKGMQPIVTHPNEFLDGGIMGRGTGHAMTSTYDVQNHGIIKELYRAHQNKEIIFAGVVMGVFSMDDDARTIDAQHVARLMKDVLKADAVMAVKYVGGAAHLGVASAAVECEKLGIRSSVHITPFTPTGTIQDNLIFNDPSLDLLVTSFSMYDPMRVEFKPEQYRGGDESETLGSDFMEQAGQTFGDEVIEQVEQGYLVGLFDLNGCAKIRAIDY